MQNEREEGLLEALQMAALRAADHRARHESLAAQFGLTECFDSFVDSVEGEKEVLIRDPEEGLCEVALRWDYQTIGRHKICKEAGFWVVSCSADAQPRVMIPGTQYGHGRYPSERYLQAVAARPNAVFAIWGNRTVCVVAFESRDYDEAEITRRFSDPNLAKAKDNFVSLTDRSRDAVRRALVTRFRYPRLIRNPIRGLWYPLPSQRSRTADYVNVHVPDFKVSHIQFLAYLDWLERSIYLDKAEFAEALRVFGLDTGVIYETKLAELMRDGAMGNMSVPIRQIEEVDESDLERQLLTQKVSRDEDVARREDELEAVRREEEQRATAEEEDRFRREQEEEESAALFENEEEESLREPSHEHCHYDEYEKEWVTEDGEACPHIPDG